VKPNQDIILAEGSVTVTIQMQARECAGILEKGSDDEKDKFMISSIVVDDALVKAAKAAKETGTKELQSVYGNLWQGKVKDDIGNRRLGVTFVLPQSAMNSSVAAATPGTPVPAASTNGAPHQQTGSSLKPPGAKATTASVPLSAAPAASPATTRSVPVASQTPSTASTITQQQQTSLSGVAAAHVQTPSKKAEEVLESSSSGPASTASVGRGHNDAETSYETLSKQYKETLATLVQVTEERDRFQAKFKDVSRELMQFKEDSRLSQKGGKFDGDFETQVTGVTTRSGYPLWQLVLVALVSFLVARMIQMSKTEFLSF
jgi:hypothetical protein